MAIPQLDPSFQPLRNYHHQKPGPTYESLLGCLDFTKNLFPYSKPELLPGANYKLDSHYLVNSQLKLNEVFSKDFGYLSTNNSLMTLRKNYYQVYFLQDLITIEGSTSKLIGLRWPWELFYFKHKMMMTLF